MPAYLNRIQLIGDLVRDPGVYITNEGVRIVWLDVTTSDNRFDEQSGKLVECPSWHRVIIFGQSAPWPRKSDLRRGMKIYLEGQLHTYECQDQSRADRSSAVIEIAPFNGTLKVLGKQKRR